ncbi:hypothetical protein [Micromonospora sp. DPT]|uniref:hypothetical protein n=1 Tax=Micromonospora sp. DPT TaxID=3142975 RepID=UPI00320A76F2
MLAKVAPKVTDWMQAWGSVAGLLMSTVAVLFTGLLFRHEVQVRAGRRIGMLRRPRPGWSSPSWS